MSGADRSEANTGQEPLSEGSQDAPDRSVCRLGDDPLLVTAFSRSNRSYEQGRYNELHISAKVKDVVDRLIEAGYLHQKEGSRIDVRADLVVYHAYGRQHD